MLIGGKIGAFWKTIGMQREAGELPDLSVVIPPAALEKVAVVFPQNTTSTRLTITFKSQTFFHYFFRRAP